MSHDDAMSRIASDPRFHELVRKRARFAWTLTALLCLVYFGFIILVAYGKAYLSTPVIAGATTTVGFPIGVGVILVAIVTTGLYVHRANGEFDSLNRQLLDGGRR